MASTYEQILAANQARQQALIKGDTAYASQRGQAQAPASVGQSVQGTNVSNVPRGISSPTAAAPTYSAPSTSSSYSAPSGLNMNAANSIVYYKQLYDQAMNAGKGKDSLDWISKQAQGAYGQLDSDTAAALKNMNATQAAAWYSGLKGQGSGNSQTDNSFQYNNVPANAQLEQQGPSEYDQIMEMLMNYMQGYDQQMAAYNDQMVAYQQQLQAQQQNQLNSLLGQYQNAQNADLAALDGQYNEAKGQLEDDTFQQWLEARQSMANRGLAGSGLASDQDTRLLMANNKNLTSLLNSVNNQKNQVKLRYGSQMDSINNQLSSLSSLPSVSGLGSSSPATASAANAGILSSYAPSAPNTTTMNMMFDIFKEMLPYTRATTKDQMNYAIDVDEQKRKWTETFGYDAETGNPTLDYLKYMLEVDKASDASDQAWTKIYGFDKQGNPTFDAKAWMAEFDLDKWYKEQNVSQGWADISIRQYKAQNDVAQGWANVQISQQNAATRIAELEQRKTEFSTTQERKDFTDQLNTTKSLMTQAYNAMNSAQSRMNARITAGLAVDENDFATYQRSKKQYDVAYAALDGLAQTGINAGAGLVKNPSNVTNFPSSAMDKLNAIMNFGR